MLKNTPETRTVAGIFVLLLLMIFLPNFAQSQDYHNFADKSILGSIPHAADVLSNIAFLIAGGYGFKTTYRLKQSSSFKIASCVLCTGLILTGLGSGFYHWAPSDETLFWDRLPMTIAFAGVFGLLAHVRVGSAWAVPISGAAVLTGLTTTLLWKYTQNLTPYIVVQFGGFIWLIIVWFSKRDTLIKLAFGQIIIWYLIAKICESWDYQIFNATSQIVSGHTLKHLAAGMAGYAFFRDMKNMNAVN